MQLSTSAVSRASFAMQHASTCVQSSAARAWSSGVGSQQPSVQSIGGSDAVEPQPDTAPPTTRSAKATPKKLIGGSIDGARPGARGTPERPPGFSFSAGTLADSVAARGAGDARGVGGVTGSTHVAHEAARALSARLVETERGSPGSGHGRNERGRRRDAQWRDRGERQRLCALDRRDTGCGVVAGEASCR